MADFTNFCNQMALNINSFVDNFFQLMKCLDCSIIESFQAEIRYPKETSFKWSQVFKGVIYVEAVFLLGSFYLYRKLCRDQNFRYNCYQKHGFILEAFYNFMDLVGHDSYRTSDYKKWNIPIDNNKN